MMSKLKTKRTLALNCALRRIRRAHRRQAQDILLRTFKAPFGQAEHALRQIRQAHRRQAQGTKFRFREIWWRRRASNPDNCNDNKWLLMFQNDVK